MNKIALLLGLVVLIVVAYAAWTGIHATQKTYEATQQTNEAADTAKKIAEHTVKNLTAGFGVKSIEGYANEDDSINAITVYVQLAPGSQTVDLKQAKIEFSANADTISTEYTYGGMISANSMPNAIARIETRGKFYVWKEGSQFEGNVDSFLDPGETYALIFKLPTALGPGKDWSITMLTSYTGEMKAYGVTPAVISKGTVINLH